MKLRIVAVAIVTVMLALTLSSCFYSNNASQTQETTTEAPAPELVKPADVAGKINLKAEDPSNDNVKFGFDSEGRVSECSYKKDDVSFYVGYTYRDGEVDVNVFATDKDAAAFVVKSLTYKTGAFDKSAGFIEKDGYYFNGFKTLEAVERETKAEDTTSDESAEDSKKADDTSAESESAKDTEKAETEGDTTAPADTASDTEKAD